MWKSKLLKFFAILMNSSDLTTLFNSLARIVSTMYWNYIDYELLFLSPVLQIWKFLILKYLFNDSRHSLLPRLLVPFLLTYDRYPIHSKFKTYTTVDGIRVCLVKIKTEMNNIKPRLTLLARLLVPVLIKFE